MRPVAILAVALVAGALAALYALRDSRVFDPAPRRAGREVSAQPSRQQATSPLAARVLRRTQLRERPGGRVVRTIGSRTGYGSARVLAVVAQRGGWLGVLSQYLPNSRAGWIPRDSAMLVAERYTLHVDRSERQLAVRRDGRLVRRIRVAVGRAANATPSGRFAITDALVIGRRGGPYGCCALALTGRQPNVPQGWSGGDRLAIHGTSDEASIGTATSSGCMRARERDMRWLLRNVPLGAPVRIRV